VTARLETQVLDRVESMTAEMVEFLQDLVRIPTVNPPGEHYVECAERMGNQLRSFGYDVEYLAAEGRAEHTSQHPRVNVIGRMRGVVERPLLHFNGHIDVVPAGEGWTVDPFAAVVKDGCVYGRGTTDQKAGIAASIFAVEALRRQGVRLHGTVEQSGSVDEESGGFAGAAYLADKGYIHRDRTDYVIITEPLNFDRVCLGHRGVYWFEVRTEGRCAHGGMPFLGVSAIDKMAGLITEIERTLRPKFALRRTAMPVEPDEARYPSLNINGIQGGQPDGLMQTPCVADLCRATFDRRYLLEEPFDQVKGEVVGILERMRQQDPEFRYRLCDLMDVAPVQTDAQSPLVRTMASAIRDVVHRDAPLIASPGTYDQKHVMRRGLVEQCIAYGPGILNLSHLPGEYCRIDHLVAATKAMALCAMRLLGTV
jgi:succinyl-diaminopimelate desuccinylase